MSLIIGDDSFLINKDNNKRIVFLNLDSAKNYIENENIKSDFLFYLYYDQLLQYYKYDAKSYEFKTTMINNTASISFNQEPKFSVLCFYSNKEIEKLYELIIVRDISLVNTYVEFIYKNIKPILDYLINKNFSVTNSDVIINTLKDKSNINNPELLEKFYIIISYIKDSLFELYLYLKKNK